MERAMSTEDKIRRAQEIYNRRRTNQIKTGTTKVKINEKKDIKLLKKMIIQIVVCLSIYSIFYLIKNNDYIFSDDFISKANEILSYDVNFQEIYSKLMQKIQVEQDTIQEETSTDENTEEINTNMEKTDEDGIGGSEEKNEEEPNEQTSELTQMEQDAIDIKNTISFINPIQGTITSKFGWRSPTTSTVPKYHTGLDIANASGTKIHSATDGDVVLASSTGDYR